MAHALRRALEKLDPQFPKPSADAQKAAAEARKQLEAEG
jgi:hypothetical protein